MYRTAGQGELNFCPCVSSCISHGLVLSFPNNFCFGPQRHRRALRSPILHSIPQRNSTSLPFSFFVPPLRRLANVTQKLTNGFVFFIGASLGPWQRRISVGEGLPAGFRMIKERTMFISDKIKCSQSRGFIFIRFSLLFIDHSFSFPNALWNYSYSISHLSERLFSPCKSSIVELHSSYPNSILLFAQTIQNLKPIRMRANWQRLMHAPAVSTFVSGSISTPSSSSIPKDICGRAMLDRVLLRHGIRYCVIANPRKTWINSSFPTVTLPSSPTLTSHYISPELLLYLPVISVYSLELHLIPFPLSIWCRWNCFVSSWSPMVEISGLQLTDLTMPGWSKILFHEDVA